MKPTEYAIFSGTVIIVCIGIVVAIQHFVLPFWNQLLAM